MPGQEKCRPVSLSLRQDRCEAGLRNYETTCGQSHYLRDGSRLVSLFVRRNLSIFETNGLLRPHSLIIFEILQACWISTFPPLITTPTRPLTG